MLVRGIGRIMRKFGTLLLMIGFVLAALSAIATTDVGRQALGERGGGIFFVGAVMKILAVFMY